MTVILIAFGYAVFFVCGISFASGIFLIWGVSYDHLDLMNWEFAVSMAFFGSFGGLGVHVLRGLFH